MPKIIRLRKFTPSASIDLERFFCFFNDKPSSESPSNSILMRYNMAFFWLEKINKHLEKHPRLLLESSIESILASLTAEKAQLQSLNINQLLNEILKLSKIALASPKITITSTGVMLDHLNFSGIKDWVEPISPDETKTPIDTLEADSADEEESKDNSEEIPMEDSEKKTSLWLIELKSRWGKLKGNISGYEQHINQRTAEIVRYFNLPPEKHEPYKTESYNRQKETISQLELKIKPARDEMALIVQICDATLNKAHQFIEPLIFAKNISVDTILMPDSLTQLLFKQHREKAKAHLKEILSEEQEPGFAYMNSYKRNEVLGGIYLLLGEHEKALPYLNNAARFTNCAHALFCGTLAQALRDQRLAVDEPSAVSAAMSR